MTSTPDPAVGGTVLAIGLMSGTSLDGIDAALLETDGEGAGAALGKLTAPYDDALRERLRARLGSDKRDAGIGALERDLTLAHADAVRALLERAGKPAESVRVIGFHGHAVLHQPECRRTWQ